MDKGITACLGDGAFCQIRGQMFAVHGFFIGWDHENEIASGIREHILRSEDIVPDRMQVLFCIDALSENIVDGVFGIVIVIEQPVLLSDDHSGV